VKVLEAVGTEEMNEEQVRGVAVQHVGRRVGHHVVPEKKALRQLRPLAQPVDRETERLESRQTPGSVALSKTALILEKRQVEVDPAARRVQGRRPRRAPAGGVGDVVHGRRRRRRSAS